MKKGSAKKKLMALFAIVFAVSMILSACSSGNSSSSSENNNSEDNDTEANNDNDNNSDDEEEVADNQELHLTAGDDIRTMDSSKATDEFSLHTLMRVDSGLLVYNGDDELKPELAKDMPEANDDNTEYTFKLRDAEWSDGSPITADQFVYAWRRGIDPDTESQYADMFASAHIKNAAKILDEDSDMYGKAKKLGVKAKDDHTLVVTLSQSTPDQYFNSLMQFPTFFPLKKEYVKKQGKDYAQEPDNILYSGPFKMEKWDHGEGWTLTPNDKYWDADKINLDKVTYKIVKDPKTDLKLYESGKIDYTGLSSEDVDKYKDDDEFSTHPTSSVFYWDLNRKKVDEFKNTKVRQALWLSMDRKSGTDVILNNGSLPANYLVPKNFAEGPDGKMFHETGDGDLDNYPGQDKDKAKKLWKEAKDELGIDKLDVELLTTDGELAKDLSEYYVNQVTKNLDGFNIDIQKVPFKSYLDKAEKGDCEICAGSGWGPDYEDPTTFLELFKTGNGQNTYGVSNKEYDDMLDKADSLGDDPEKRWEVLQKADKYLSDNAVFIPTYQKGTSVLVKPYVKDFNFQEKDIGVGTFYRYGKILKH